jgi:single-strand DNA-binding protein
VKTIETTWTPVVNFTVATNRKYTNKEWNTMEDAEYHRCVAYGKWAEVLGKYLVKGKRIYVEGRLRTRKWQDSEGADKFSTEIIVDSFIFLDSKWEWGEDESFGVEGSEPAPGIDEEMPF